MRRIVSLSWIALGTIGCSYPPLSASLPFCIGSRPKVCLPDAPTATVTLNQDTEIDTDHRTDSLLECDGDNDQMGFCVIAAQSITITSAAKLRAFGRRPLVLLASGMIDIQGTIDVSSTSAAATMDAGAGAGADPTTCRTAAAPMGTVGGAGGSFGGKGSAGQFKPDLGGTSALSADALTELPDLRGGCPGGAGGNPNRIVAGSRIAGAGGHGGGAVALVAAELRISGTLNASGAGGAGGPGRAGAPELPE